MKKSRKKELNPLIQQVGERYADAEQRLFRANLTEDEEKWVAKKAWAIAWEMAMNFKHGLSESVEERDARKFKSRLDCEIADVEMHLALAIRGALGYSCFLVHEQIGIYQIWRKKGDRIDLVGTWRVNDESIYWGKGGERIETSGPITERVQAIGAMQGALQKLEESCDDRIDALKYGIQEGGKVWKDVGEKGPCADWLRPNAMAPSADEVLKGGYKAIWHDEVPAKTPEGWDNPKLDGARIDADACDVTRTWWPVSRIGEWMVYPGLAQEVDKLIKADAERRAKLMEESFWGMKVLGLPKTMDRQAWDAMMGSTNLCVMSDRRNPGHIFIGWDPARTEVKAQEPAQPKGVTGGEVEYELCRDCGWPTKKGAVFCRYCYGRRVR